MPIDSRSSVVFNGHTFCSFVMFVLVCKLHQVRSSVYSVVLNPSLKAWACANSDVSLTSSSAPVTSWRSRNSSGCEVGNGRNSGPINRAWVKEVCYMEIIDYSKSECHFPWTLKAMWLSSQLSETSLEQASDGLWLLPKETYLKDLEMALLFAVREKSDAHHSVTPGSHLLDQSITKMLVCQIGKTLLRNLHPNFSWL